MIYNSLTLVPVLYRMYKHIIRLIVSNILNLLTRSDFDDSKKDKKPKRKEGVKVRLLR